MGRTHRSHRNHIQSRTPQLVRALKDYPWSSWLEYIGSQTDNFCSTQVVLNRITPNDLTQLVEQPLTEDEEDGMLDIEQTPVKTYYTDTEIWQVLTSLSGATTLSDFQKLPRPQQKHILWKAHEPSLDSPESHIPSCSEPPAKPMSKSFTPIWYAKIAPKTSFGTPIAKKTNMNNIQHTNEASRDWYVIPTAGGSCSCPLALQPTDYKKYYFIIWKRR